MYTYIHSILLYKIIFILYAIYDTFINVIYIYIYIVYYLEYIHPTKNAGVISLFNFILTCFKR